ncbi:23S rRNA pseudouridine(955/2504/2580) synthase RluC [Simiduia sp. 21SJ11W-1]|uniref:23S rRNA pseudouridine(955/2504/2580) synthase RluC n=1 Tax=Simiduia sp. 21SJ11W-1 TaxID=2909669 RepID=UPI00209DFB22|nr:23S rRNA pseudouridine(955/2504/2580) synthase RluC [Simiduia sp. 21SJ11W-1]UTA46349.1 23S rRNA pseudouridine(955/2504/2580) synthase RluC [Simiduia sp. 21SJ11W-1]
MAEFHQVQFFTVEPDYAGQRIDNFLLARLKGVPKSRIYRLLRKGEVRVNKGRVKPEYKVCAGDSVRVPPIRLAEAGDQVPVGPELAARLEAAILFEDALMLAVNKPPGLAVHGGSGVQVGLIEALRQMRPECKFLELVHRIDRETSGIVLVAKKRTSLKMLQAQFREKSENMTLAGIKKTYWALVDGQWPAARKAVDEPLLRTELANGDRIVRVSAEGKPSKTLFKVLALLRGASWVEAMPVTGRTHQIRVHARIVGCPLLGDGKYGDDGVNAKLKAQGLRRLCLHAARLEFLHPEDERPMTLAAPMPEDMQQLVEALGC